ncbi:hypothetical protein PybrP1_000931 [[Pythium] brassicae (nom. inval.)]|nr:hypothetical protein PybrP1_000931 [[Pythium] brassicae (nom. inval.)]
MPRATAQKVPDNIPLETTHLYLMGNRFARVLPEMLQGHAQNADGTFSRAKNSLAKLKVIRLDLNPVAIVNEHAFAPAPTLELIYLPFDVKIQRQAFAEMKTDKLTFDGFTRVAAHPLEDPHFAAFARS